MISSMTGFASREDAIKGLGKVSVELRSTNHKFLETVFHLPVGFLSLEERIKKEIEAKIKRGRLICAVNVLGQKSPAVSINTDLIKKYSASLKDIQHKLKIKDGVKLDTLIHLPGALSVEENKISSANIWPQLKMLVKECVNDLEQTRKKEGGVLFKHLKNKASALERGVKALNLRFKLATKNKSKGFSCDEEITNFLRNSDINEEIERLTFHISNFKSKLFKVSPIGKELDFIAQEMQREANTIASKTFDSLVSAKIVQIKSQIEKIREQVQNIE